MRNETKYVCRQRPVENWRWRRAAGKGGEWEWPWQNIAATERSRWAARTKRFCRPLSDQVPISVSPRLSLFLPTFISLPLSLSLTFIYFYSPLSVLLHGCSRRSFYRLLWPDLATLIRILIPCSQLVSFTLSKLHSWTCPKRNVIFPHEVFRNLFRFWSKILK